LRQRRKGAGGNEPTDSDDPNDPGRKIYFKDYNLEGDAYITLAAGSWQLFAQSNEGVEQEIKDVYQQYGSRNLELVDCRDSVRTIRIAGVNRNDYGLEMVFEENSVINSIWLIYAEGDTLYYTSPEYPPRTTWKAKRIMDADFESIRLNVQYPGYLSGIKRMPETVPEETKGSIAGVWKLVKDIDRGIDYSCDNITYHFPAYGDSTLTVTSDREDYPSGVYDYSYVLEGACPLVCPSKRTICYPSREFPYTTKYWKILCFYAMMMLPIRCLLPNFLSGLNK
jgi:hypothetical protein